MSLNTFHLDQTLLLAINKLLAKLWLDSGIVNNHQHLSVAPSPTGSMPTRTTRVSMMGKGISGAGVSFWGDILWHWGHLCTKFFTSDTIPGQWTQTQNFSFVFLLPGGPRAGGPTSSLSSVQSDHPRSQASVSQPEGAIAALGLGPLAWATCFVVLQPSLLPLALSGHLHACKELPASCLVGRF